MPVRASCPVSYANMYIFSYLRLRQRCSSIILSRQQPLPSIETRIWLSCNSLNLLTSATPPIFVNADMIAAGLSPFEPEREAAQAGKLMLSQIAKLVANGESFCIETTLAGKGYAQKIPLWKEQGYTVDCVFLSLPNPEMAITRVAARVKQGGHNIPEDVIRRRFSAGLNNFHTINHTP